MMNIPLPKMLSDVGPGGGIVDALGAINALGNANHLRKINQAKATYAPLTTVADAASKIAYYNLMGPQYLAKMLGNEGVLGNLSEDQIKEALRIAANAGMGGGGSNNAINKMMNDAISQSTTPPPNPLSWVYNHLKGALTQKPQQNALLNPVEPQNQQAQSPNSLLAPSPAEQQPQQPAAQSQGSGNPELDAAFMDWLKSPEGQAEVAKPSARIPDQKFLLDRLRAKNGQPASIDMTLTQGQKSQDKTYAEKAADYKSIQAEGKALGTHRGDTISDLGKQQLQLSNSGAALDSIIEDINAPEFMALRKDFPFYQNMQLTALSKVGSPEQQEMIGNFIADIKSFAGATVNSFKGQTMKREFDYADQLKPNENDTVNSARGKLTALKSLKEIAERKNNIIIDLMQNKHLNIGDAVKEANKRVDIKSIREEVKKLTSPMITIKNPKHPELELTLPLWEARKRGVKNV